MSIISVVYVPEGIAMAADSRLTANRNIEGGREIFTLSDNAQKLFLLSNKKIGVSWCGDVFIQEKTIADFLRIFEIEKLVEEDNVISVAQKLNEYLSQFEDGQNTYFFVCGFEKDIPYVYVVGSSICDRKNAIEDTEQIFYGARWNGDYKAVDKLIKDAEINYSLMPLKDAIDLADYLIELVIKYQRFEAKVSTCGGPIDVLVITKDYAKFVRHKILNP